MADMSGLKPLGASRPGSNPGAPTRISLPLLCNHTFDIWKDRRARWQARKKASGMCYTCGKLPAIDTHRCEGCYLKNRKLARRKAQCGAQHTTGRGRPQKGVVG